MRAYLLPFSCGLVRVALVTGGNRGMGFEICRQLASSGLTVVLAARSETRGAEAARELRGLGLPDVVSHQLDVTEPTSAARLADFVRTKFGKLDVLVRTAPPIRRLLSSDRRRLRAHKLVHKSHAAGQQRGNHGGDDGGWRRRGSRQRNGT
jgi:NAD(P)-dependent dehydrogenase (short-subunit alcohol dehydrogenase family)